MAIDWAKYQVACASCGATLTRRLFRPYDNRRIENFFCDRSCKGEWQLQKIVSEEWLRLKYLSEQMDCNQIAVLVNRDAKSVWNWLKRFGIATRPRGTTGNAPLFVKGQQNRLGCKLTEAHREQLRQARKRDGHFPKSQNGDPYWKGRTGSVHPSWKGGITPDRQAFYSSEEWKAVRPQVYGRANNHCERCGADRTRQLHIHHIVSFSCMDLRAVLSNLALLCIDCHHFVHSTANIKGEYRGTISHVSR